MNVYCSRSRVCERECEPYSTREVSSSQTHTEHGISCKHLFVFDKAQINTCINAWIAITIRRNIYTNKIPNVVLLDTGCKDMLMSK